MLELSFRPLGVHQIATISYQILRIIQTTMHSFRPLSHHLCSWILSHGLNRSLGYHLLVIVGQASYLHIVLFSQAEVMFEVMALVSDRQLTTVHLSLRCIPYFPTFHFPGRTTPRDFSGCCLIPLPPIPFS